MILKWRFRTKVIFTESPLYFARRDSDLGQRLRQVHGTVVAGAHLSTGRLKGCASFVILQYYLLLLDKKMPISLKQLFEGEDPNKIIQQLAALELSLDYVVCYEEYKVSYLFLTEF